MQITASRPAASLSPQEVTEGKASYKGLVLFIFFVICALIVTVLDRPPGALPEQASLSVFSAERAARHLAIIGRAPHPINSPEHDVVRDYILRTLRELGLTPEVQRTTDVNERYGITGALENIVCRLKGSSQDKAVLLVAHYDSVAAGPGVSDDGVAVAAFLEGARILKSLPQLKRDVIFLFTDGEEEGLLGARAFVSEHPWAHDVGFVLNFEARGTTGPSIMFETSDENGWLIRNFGQAASHPVANSLSYEIYKRLPNNTDFTIFRRAGYAGLNFAFIDGLAYYHTSRDSLQNADHGSLQHHGDYVVELARQFGNAGSDDPRPGNVVYFDVLGRVLVRYGQGIAVFLLALTGVLVAFTLYLGHRKECMQIGNCLLGLVAMLAGVVVTVLGAAAASWLTAALRPYSSGIRAGLLYEGGWYILAFSAVGLACGAAFYLAISKRIGSENLVAGGFAGWIGLIIAVSIYFPGGSYLFLWPLLFSVLGWIAVFARRQTSADKGTVLLALSSIPAIVVMVPMIHKIFFAFASQSTLMVSALLGLLLSLLIGQIAATTSSKRWLLPLLLVTVGLGLFIIAVSLSGVPVNG